MTAHREPRVLLLNLYYPPDSSATARIARDVVDAMVCRGLTVTVVAGRPSYDAPERTAWRPWVRASVGGADIERVGSTAFDRRVMAGRVLNYLTYAAMAFVRGQVSGADVILAMTDPPITPVIGAMISSVRRIPLVINVRDLHPDMAIAAGIVRAGVVTSVWERIHRWALARADLVLVLGDDMRHRIIDKGVEPERVVVVRDGAVPQGLDQMIDARVIQEIRRSHKFVVVHAGNIGFAGAWTSLLQAAMHCQHDDIAFVFVGGGAAADTLRRRAACVGNVYFQDARPEDEVVSVLAAGDLQLVTLRPGLEGLVVPSKIYPLLMAGRPILAVAPDGSDIAVIVRAANCGWVVSPDDPRQIAAAIKEAVAAPAMLHQFGANARKAGLLYVRSELMTDLARHVADVVRP